MTVSENLKIQSVSKANLSELHSLMKGLADYERKELPVTLQRLSWILFESKVFTEGHIAYFNDEAVGYSLHYLTYLSFPGELGLFLEDLYVYKNHQNKKIGFELMRKTVERAKQLDCKRIEWHTLDWNEPAIAFWGRIGAKKMNTHHFRLEGDSFDTLGI